MKKYYLFCLLSFISTSLLFAQRPDGLAPNGEGPVAVGTIKGKVVDAQSGKPVEYATIAVKSMRDSTKLLGTLADEKGYFEIEKVPFGKYLLKVTFMGYRTYRTDTLKIRPNATIIDLGTIQFEQNSKQLEDVEVKGERDAFQTSIDKQVFNVEKSAIVTGGSATDVLRQVPTVNMDMDGGINVRGSSNITVWINGKPSGITGANRQAILDQIPASTIESVELITNPSARYDAEGMGGIINIILKKNRADGINGTASVGLGTRDQWNISKNKYNAINKYNGSFSLNLKTGKFNISTNYGYRYNHAWHTIDNKRLNFLPNERSYNLDQFTTADTLINQSHAGGINVDYVPNDKNTFGLGVSGGYNTNNNPELIVSDWRDINSNQFQYRNRNLDNKSDGYNIDVNGYYRKTFEKKGKEFNVSASYSNSGNYGDSRFKQQDFYINSGFIGSPVSNSSLSTDQKNNVGVVQIDYILPVNEKLRFETGAKSTYRMIDTELLADSILPSTQEKINDKGRINRFLFTELVSGVYALAQYNFGIFSVQAGLRGEQTNVTGQNRVSSNGQFGADGVVNRQDYFNLFPSAHISRKFEKDQEIRLSYSQRINRPGSETLNPFPTWNNPLDLRFGNPFIRPELTNSMEFSYNKTWEKHNFTGTVYYRQTDNSIQRVRNITTDGVSLIEFKNTAYLQNYGIELVLKNSITKWWSVVTNFNTFSILLVGENTRNENVTANTRVMSSMKVGKSLDIQITGNYMLPQATLQGTFEGFNGVDIGIRKEVFKGKGFISANLSDIFDTRDIRVAFNNGQNFSGGFLRKRETRVLTINFTYKFGKELTSVRRGKKAEYNTDGGGGGF